MLGRQTNIVLTYDGVESWTRLAVGGPAISRAFHIFQFYLRCGGRWFSCYAHSLISPSRKFLASYRFTPYEDACLHTLHTILTRAEAGTLLWSDNSLDTTNVVLRTGVPALPVLESYVLVGRCYDVTHLDWTFQAN